MSERLQVWYCTKYDEIHLIRFSFSGNLHIRQIFVDETVADGEWWGTTYWPLNYIFVGYL